MRGHKYFVDESGYPDPPERKMRKKKPIKKIPVNSKLPEDVLQRWHIFAAQNKLNKENALAELINRGAKA